MTYNTLEFFPESFNQLRKVLVTEHEDLWAKVGYHMAYDHLKFITAMNAELDCICLPEQSISEVCDKYLEALKHRKGKPAVKSFEVTAYEERGGNIFGSAEDDLAREEHHNWKLKKGLLQ